MSALATKANICRKCKDGFIEAGKTERLTCSNCHQNVRCEDCLSLRLHFINKHTTDGIIECLNCHLVFSLGPPETSHVTDIEGPGGCPYCGSDDPNCRQCQRRFETHWRQALGKEVPATRSRISEKHIAQAIVDLADQQAITLTAAARHPALEELGIPRSAITGPVMSLASKLANLSINDVKQRLVGLASKMGKDAVIDGVLAVPQAMKDGKSQRCPKCHHDHLLDTTPRTRMCLKCLTEFPSTLSVSQRSTTIISNPSEIQKLANVMCNRCPICSCDQVSPVSDGLSCRECNAVWRPHSVKSADFECVKGAFNDNFWEAVCPGCQQEGQIAKLASGALQCLLCDKMWQPKTIDFSGLRTKEEKSEVDELANRVCTSCKKGFYHNGICMQCTAKQKRDWDGGRKKAMIRCIRCQHVDSLEEADLYAKCNNCEDAFPVKLTDLPSGVQVEQPFPPAEFGKSWQQVDERDWEQFQRYLSVRGEIEGHVDQIITSQRDMFELFQNQEDCTDEFIALESAVASLSESQQWVQFGSDEDHSEPIDGDQLFEHDDDETQKWREFDRINSGFQRATRVEYTDVELIDNGTDLLANEDMSYHDELLNEEELNLEGFDRCGSCDGLINRKGYCSNCHMKYVYGDSEADDVHTANMD